MFGLEGDYFQESPSCTARLTMNSKLRIVRL